MASELETGLTDVASLNGGHEPTTVLVVDDDEAFASLLRACLSREDPPIEVLAVTDGNAALETLEARRIDCVVADYVMPGMDGLQLAEEVADGYPELPFLLLTGRGDEETATRAIRAGVDDYIRKSEAAADFAFLADRIRSHVDRDRAGSMGDAAWRQATVGLSIHDPETGAFLDVNDRFCRMVGYTREELVGSPLEQITPGGDAYNEDRARELIQRAASEGPITFEWLDETRDGEELWVEVTLRPARIRGRQCVMAGIHDIGQRRTREETLAAVYETIADPDLGFDEKVDELMTLGRDVLGTDFATLSRIEDEDYVFEHVQSPGDQIQPGDVVSIRDTLCRETVLQAGRLVVDDALEARSRTRGKALQLACYVGAPVYLDGDPLGTFCFYDVEPREQPFSDWEVTLVELMSRWISSEMDRIRARRELERENERLDDFASMVSHDLQTPLSIATGHLGLMRKEIEHESLAETLVALDRIDEIVEDALLWARTGSAVEETQPVWLPGAAEAAWSLVEHDGARLDVEAETTIRAEESRLRQLLENLFRNAVEHGGPEVSIVLLELEDGFAVEDDGPGFPADAGDEVFETGYSTRAGGTGFGLAIVEQIAEAHGWTIALTQGQTGGARLEVRGVEGVHHASGEGSSGQAAEDAA